MTYGFPVARGQRDVLVQVVDRVAEMEREGVLAARLKEADELGSGAGAELHTGEVHALQRLTLAMCAASTGFLTAFAQIRRKISITETRGHQPRRGAPER